MIVNGKVYILEMNNRFQGSTPLLNLALKEAGMPSMQELNFDSFQNKKSKIDINNLKVPYSCFVYLANEQGKPCVGHRKKWIMEKQVAEVWSDGLNYEWEIAPYATLERLVFHTNIVSITYEDRVILHPNVSDM